MLRWDEALTHCRSALTPCVLVTVLGTSGSAPRDPGAKMVVTADALHDTIGGGRLELLATETARELLAGDDTETQHLQHAQHRQHAQHLQHYPLGQAAGQCCGGAVSLLFERIIPACTPLALFGAGHVGQALARILAELPFHLFWVDSRADRLPAPAPLNQQPMLREDPLSALAELPPDVPALVMTHDHELDFELVRALLLRSTSAPVGLIASPVKAARFRLRLAAAGTDETALARLQAPVGLEEVGGKEPMAVAVSIAAVLLRDLHPTQRSADVEPGRSAGLPWSALRALQREAHQDADGSAADDQERSA